ncbi:uncharacterized protein At4g08330, chloroplastic-like isoform X5 [Salvia hispanica]|uniref:uncharacterized protein At4g08330, chloroplastic-like isoform X5 n=1 Tax=Salvia hispanica TaxID=49212 RepID=UPI0020093388|nr:uncharacterized protein At4g08330, chloroplastic-like isoform X5 [Salvia hispanica]
METSGGSYSSNQQFSASFAGSRRDVTYSCGSCGYDLNLNSSSRNTSTIGSKYGKSIKKGIISFFTIDESRFNQAEEFSCVPYFIFKHSCGIFSRKTKLLCRKCGNLVGIASDLNNDSPIHLITDGSDSPSSSEFTSKRNTMYASNLMLNTEEVMLAPMFQYVSKKHEKTELGESELLDI